MVISRSKYSLVTMKSGGGETLIILKEPEMRRGCGVMLYPGVANRIIKISPMNISFLNVLGFSPLELSEKEIKYYFLIFSSFY
jgi:hypothetical protein